MSYRLTLKSFKEKQEAQDGVILAINDRVKTIEDDLGYNDPKDPPVPPEESKYKFDLLSFLIGLFLGGGVVFVALAVFK